MTHPKSGNAPTPTRPRPSAEQIAKDLIATWLSPFYSHGGIKDGIVLAINNERALLAQRDKRVEELEARYQRYQELFPGAINRIDELDREVEALRAEVKRLEKHARDANERAERSIETLLHSRQECDALRDGLEKCAKAMRKKLDYCRRSGDCADIVLMPGEVCSEECLALTQALSAAQALLSHTQTEPRPIQVGDVVLHRTEGWTGTVETSDGYIVGVNCKHGLYGVSQLERVEPEKGEPAER